MLEKLRQENAALERRSEPFVQFIDKVTGGKFIWYAHALKLAKCLQRVADGELKRLMVFMPPRHGKTELVSKLFPAYMTIRHPERFVGICGYSADLARTYSQRAREYYLEGGGGLKSDAGRLEHWETPQGGGMWSAGIGGAMTGKGAHCLIIDDPIKNAKEALSETVRQAHWDWYNSTFYTRCEPNSSIVIVQTRWHEKDLSGRLIEHEKSLDEDEEPEGWHVVNMPALYEPPIDGQFPANMTLEPDGRKIGEALCPQRYPAKRLKKIFRNIREYYSGALFQQRPTAREGSMFKLEYMQQTVREIPAAITTWVRAWDFASTQDDGDYTVGVLMGYLNGRVYIADVVRGQWSSGTRNQIVLNTCLRDAEKYGRFGVEFVLEKDAGSAGKDTAREFMNMLEGYRAFSVSPSGDKVIRADPLSAQFEAGNVILIDAPWNEAYREELRAFPRGAHDDQVDASSAAYNRITYLR